MTVLAPEIATATQLEPVRLVGRVSESRGMTVYVDELPAPVGALVSIGRRSASEASLGEIVGFTRDRAIVMMLGQTSGVRAGDPVETIEFHQTGAVGDRMLGRVLNGLGQPIDGKGPVPACVRRPLDPKPLTAMERERVTQPLDSGVRAVDLMTTLGRGQRLGIFAGPGVGKSTLLGMIARRTAAEVNVIALIGERGREVRDFLEESLGEEGLARSVVVVATGDESPLMRLRAAKLACTASEYFRERGKSVMLMMDSVTRFAHAQRQVGLSVGEPPATKGYTPSVFAQLALLLERAGAVTDSGGAVTALYTILVEGDDMTEPVADAARGILDGHLVLSRKLAHKGHFPAIDVLDSVSRVADEICTPEHAAARRVIRSLLAKHREVEDLVQIGAYARGSDPEADVALELKQLMDELLRQGVTEPSAGSGGATDRLLGIAERAAAMIQQKRAEQAA